MTVFLATLGQRPEAITMALDRLLPRYAYDEMVILHTDPHLSDIAAALKALLPVLANAYPDTPVRGHILRFANHAPLVDITDQHSAEAYYHGLLEVLRDYRVEQQPIHLLIAGGRKAMSAYATLAAVLLFGEYDRVWTVLTPQALMQPGLFHTPPGQHDAVTLVQLPVNPSRLLPGMLAEQDVGSLLDRASTSPRQRFMDALTRQEYKLAELCVQHPYATTTELGDLLLKSPKTIESQLRSIYSKLFSYFDLVIDDKHKRKALIDVISGRV